MSFLFRFLLSHLKVLEFIKSYVRGPSEARVHGINLNALPEVYFLLWKKKKRGSEAESDTQKYFPMHTTENEFCGRKFKFYQWWKFKIYLLLIKGKGGREYQEVVWRRKI